jgi:assimilatory nitrate reductase catalytic subunit
LTDPVLDPLSKMPAFKACAVAAERAGGPDDDHLLTTKPATLRIRPVVLPSKPSVIIEALTPARRRSTTTQQRGKDHRMPSKNHFLQGVFAFEGAGLDKPAPLHADLTYVVPDGAVAQTLYFRGGNSSDELVALVLMKDGVPLRYFPIGAKSDVHVPLRVVEDIEGGSAVELYLAAPEGATGSVVIDVGLVEV